MCNKTAAVAGDPVADADTIDAAVVVVVVVVVGGGVVVVGVVCVGDGIPTPTPRNAFFCTPQMTTNFYILKCQLSHDRFLRINPPDIPNVHIFCLIVFGCIIAVFTLWPCFISQCLIVMFIFFGILA